MNDQERSTLSSVGDKQLTRLFRLSCAGFQIEPAQSDGTVRFPDLSSLREPNAMEPEKILHELTYAEGLPREALKAASGQRFEMLPLFLDEIETYLALEPAARAKPAPLFFIFHLLGEWREKAAYKALARLLRLPPRDVDAIFGDGITTTSHRVMAAVFDGDPEPLYEIIFDPKAEEFIRAGMCEALAVVTLLGELDRAVAGRFLRDAFVEIRPQAECYVWVGWQSAIAKLGMGDLKILVKKAFDRGFIDSHILGFDHFEADLRRGIDHPGEPWLPDDRDSTLFGDTVEELSGWYCFSEQYRYDQERWRRRAEADSARSQRHENPFKGVGRNAPCPCGSGKKFNKCCLATLRAGSIGPEVAFPDRPGPPLSNNAAPH
jgi:hypothetical protein